MNNGFKAAGISLFLVFLISIITPLKSDELGKTKAIRAAEKARQLASGQASCAGRYDTGPSTEEEIVLWAVGGAAAFVPYGQFVTAAIFFEEGGRVLGKWDIEHNQWRCFETQCLKQAVIPPGGMTTQSLIDLLDLKNHNFSEWIEQNQETRCQDLMRNQRKNAQSCDSDDCLFPVSEIPSIGG
ncbi:MAG: hypothetical protein RBU27_13965 [Bacteroidota bacterium]|jgi:uncharacterized protein YcaQ|nr:hypothetical protein [Bacteroidota bacterium]